MPAPTWNYTYAYEIDSDSKISSTNLGSTFAIIEQTPGSTLTVAEITNVTGGSGQFSSAIGVYFGFWRTGTYKWPVINVGGVTYVFTNIQYNVGDTVVTSNSPLPICFGPDVQIATPDGHKKVSELVIGDPVLTPSGAQRLRFIGRSSRFLPELRAGGKMPIEIRAGALVALGPTQDLLCSPGHAFLIEGHLVEAQALVNGATIRQLETWHDFQFTYFSVELEQHQLIWANGVLSETYYANVRETGFSRDAWDNLSEYQALYGEGASMHELEMPRIPFARQLPAAVRERIHAAQKQPALIG